MLRRFVVGFALLGFCLATPCWAQNTRKPEPKRPTLASRLSSFRDSFRRDSDKQQESTSNRSRFSPSSIFGGGGNTQPADSRPPMPYDPADLKRANSGKPSAQSTRQASSPRQQYASRTTRAESTKQASSQPARKATTPITKTAAEPVARAARRSPVFGSRQDELDEALSDLFAPASDTPPKASGREELPSYLQGLVAEESVREVQPEAVDASQGSAKATANQTNDKRTRFDLHGALIGSAANSATEVAESTHEAEESESVVANVEQDLHASLGAPPEGEERAEEPEESPSVESEMAQTMTSANSTEPDTFDVPPITGDPLASELEADDPLDITPTLEPTDSAVSASSPSEAEQAFEEAPADESVTFEEAPATSTSPTLPSDSIVSNTIRRDNVLLSYQQPVIQSHVEGPRQIVVGREATYRVVLKNSGETSANKLTATVEIPAWADVVDASASSGIVQRAADTSLADESRSIEWRLHDLPGRSEQQLELRLIPRAGRPLQLGVQWTHAPIGAQAMVEVQEPKLALMLAGPSDVLFGRPQRYQLTISNPGTGTAEEVAIQLTPPGAAADEVIDHKIGILAPGESKELELELTARDAGELTVQAAAVAAGDLRTETSKSVMCRKPELEIDWRGPEKKYSGTVATYYFRVRNPGTAATEPFTVSLDLPKGSEFVSASEGGRQTIDGKQVTWKAPALAPGQERFLQVRCKLTAGGNNQLTVTAETAEAELRDEETIVTNVVALADLKLHVSDPRGPLPVGEPAEYEIRVVNRGNTAARDVNVTALFSTGIDPVTVEGGQHSIRDGRVSFKTIESLAAGGEVKLKIRAQASKAGTHIFRAEVGCTDLDIKLAAEETTRFFQDERRWEDASTAYSSDGSTK